MASGWNMLPFFPSTESNAMDPSPKSCPKALFAPIYNANILPPLSVSAHPDSPKAFLSKPLIQEPLSIESLNTQIKELLHQKLVYHVVNGKPSDTVLYHRRQLLVDLNEWIRVFQEDTHRMDAQYRDQLMTLLVSSSKYCIQDIPPNESCWLKLLQQWIKANSSGAVLSRRRIYTILAVDGFRGCKPKDLKQYLSNVLLPLRTEYQMHAIAVRAMYAFFDTCPKITSLTGTDSANVVFLALLNAYKRAFKDDVMLDDQIAYSVEKTKKWVEGCLFQHGESFPDIKHVNEKVLKVLANVYLDHFIDKTLWKQVGLELLNTLNLSNTRDVGTRDHRDS